MSKKQLIRKAANKIGHWRKPKEYIEQVLQDDNVVCSNSLVWKTLGPYDLRISQTINPMVDRYARHYLSSCGDDITFSIHVLKAIAAK